MPIAILIGVMISGYSPQVAIDDKRMYPVYATCADLGLPVLCCVGVPGPRVPMAAQHVERVDEVCWFFPELTFVMRHGAEPWEDLAVKLMLKWPNLYYSTSACAPRYYPPDALMPVRSMASWAAWRERLLEVSRHDGHAWNAPLLIEALVTQASRAWRPRTSADALAAATSIHSPR